MSKTLRTLKKGIVAGIKAASESIENPPRAYKSAGQPVRCSQCSGEVFKTASLFAEIVSDGSALQCVRCSHLEFFGNRDAIVEETS
jgi:hypothetical protein